MVRSTSTWYDEATGLVIKSQDAGDAARVDETCTITSYASNTTTGLVSYPSRVVASKGLCDASSASPGQDRLISDVKTLYDAGAFGVAPTKGDIKSLQRLSSYDAGVPRYSTTVTNGYDTLGRPTSTTDALGRTTDTAYTPAGQGALTQTVVQAPPVVLSNGSTARLTTKTAFLPEWGVASQATDPNQKVTDLAYDVMGRLTGVWLPSRSKSAGDGPNTKYTYNLSPTVASSIRTDKLNITANGYLTSFALYDSLLRPRQSQQPSVNGGRIINESKYDSRGLVIIENRDLWDEAEPSGSLVSVLDAETPAQTQSTYDGAGRLTMSTFAVAAQTKWSTRTVYGGDTVTTLPPAGAAATAEIRDALGQVVERREYDANTVTPGYIPTTYTYDPAGRLAKVVNAGATWTYSYDLLGRKVATTDPDSGASTYGYDAADRLVSTTNANQQTLLTTFDNLDRRVAVHEGAKTDAQLRASWLYDGAGNLGQALGSIRYPAGKTGPQYKNLIASRNVLYSPTSTTVVIPAAEGPELAGTYTTNTGYSPDGLTPSFNFLPGGGPIGSEKVNYTYTRLGQPVSVEGGYGTYVKKVAYTELGDPEQYNLGDDNDLVIQQAFEDGTRRLKRAMAASGPTISANHGYTYDSAGNVLKDDNVVGPDVQCYDYDAHRRLTDAWTPGSGDCTAAPAVAGLGGPAPYWQSWTYTADGQRKTETGHVAAGNTTATYTYAAGRPHAVSKVATTGAAPKPDANYSYDPAGNTTTRPAGGGQQTLDWNVEGKLSKLSTQSGDTTYIYDAEGNLLLRKSASKSTLFVGSLELTVESSSGTKMVSAQRHYSVGGRDVAVRSGVDKLDWLATDYQNTAELTLDNATHTPTVRYTTPFGGTRGAAVPSWPDTHGFLGKSEDKSTGLTHIGAREYDPSIGRFLSVDPLIDVGDPNSLLGYAYANNNPRTFSDPDGACPLYEGESRCGSHPTPVPPPDTHHDDDDEDKPPSTGAGHSNDNRNDDTSRAIRYAQHGNTPGVVGAVSVIRELNLPAATPNAPEHAFLDVCGLAQGAGELCDATNAVWYATEREYWDAFLSGIAVFPVAGIIPTVAKWGKRADKAGKETAGVAMAAKLTSNEKGKLGAKWSAEAAEARGETIVGIETGLTFKIKGKDVTIHADVLSRTAEGQYVYIEAKYSPRAPFTPNQKQVVPELVKSGEGGLTATVTNRTGGGIMQGGQKINVIFQGDVWNSGPVLFGR